VSEEVDEVRLARRMEHVLQRPVDDEIADGIKQMENMRSGRKNARGAGRTKEWNDRGLQKMA
jgi:hypothetical protein